MNSKEVREIWKFEATLSEELPTGILTLQQILSGIAEINRKLERLKN